jgi:uncharacterized protein
MLTQGGWMKRFHSVSDVAARFEVTSQTVRNWIAAGQLASVQPTAGGRYRIPAQALLEFEQQSSLAPTRGRRSAIEAQPQARDAARPVPGDPGRSPLPDTEVNRADGSSAGSMANDHLSEPIASELSRVVRAIVHATQPDAVILFGSRARGDFGADSDFDLAILAPEGVGRRRIAIRAYESLAEVAGRTVAVDIVVLTPSVISAERDLTGSIARAVSRDGVVVYESTPALA